MWQLSEAIDGMAQACEALAIPVIGGNVSLYDESGGRDIDPTPVIAVVGLLGRIVRKPPVPGWHPGDSLVVLGPPPGGLAGSSLGEIGGGLRRRCAGAGRPGVTPGAVPVRP